MRGVPYHIMERKYIYYLLLVSQNNRARELSSQVPAHRKSGILVAVLSA